MSPSKARAASILKSFCYKLPVNAGKMVRSNWSSATLQINTNNEHIRFRYMHMNPSAMEADGILNGRRVRLLLDVRTTPP